jgi:hypothetical protein
MTERVAALWPREVPANDAHQMLRRVLFAAGVLSSLLYLVATDIVAAEQWDNYSRTGEMVSKLFAVGSPARSELIVLVGGVYTVLMIVFGLGVWLSANRNRALRVTGALLIGYGVANLVALLFPLDLSSNASVPMHIVATNMLLVLMLGAMGSELRRSTDGSACTRSRRWSRPWSQALYRSWPRLMHRRQCWASASESASARSCCGLQFLPLRCGVRRWTPPGHSTMKRPRFGAASLSP